MGGTVGDGVISWAASMSDLRTLVERAYRSLDVVATFVGLKPPATSAQLEEHKKNYECAMPTAVRRFFEEVSRDALFVWSIPRGVRRDLQLSAEFGFIESGQLVAGIDLGPPLFESFGEWADVYPLAQGVGIKPNGELWIGDFWNTELKLRQDPEEFFMHWAQLGFVFPDKQHLEPFVNKRTRALNSDGRLGRKWRGLLARWANI